MKQGEEVVTFDFTLVYVMLCFPILCCVIPSLDSTRKNEHIRLLLYLVWFSDFMS